MGQRLPAPRGQLAEYRTVSARTTSAISRKQDGRKILGENAVNFYGLDRQRLQAVADKIGPTAALFN